VKTLSSRRTARLAAAAVVSAGALVTTAALALPASAASHHTLFVRQIAFGKDLHHKYQANGKGAWHTETLTQPDDISALDGRLYVGFQNATGPQGEPSANGDLDSTIVEFTLHGQEVRQWDVPGHTDGVTADPMAGKVIVTVNEDANSSLFTISAATGHLTHYAYNEPLPHKGGTDAVSVYHGQILISASAPGTTGTAPKNAPAVYVVSLNPWTKIAATRGLFNDNSTARAVNGPHKGTNVTLALTDPDSNEVVPHASPKFGGDFMLDSQGDQELIFDQPHSRAAGTGAGASLSVLAITRSVDDTAWATSHSGALYITDATADTVDQVTGWFPVGTAYSSVTPCDSSSAPATCPGPGYPANYLATVNLTTGALTEVVLSGAPLQPKGQIFVRF
jgi:hypothetical protein